MLRALVITAVAALAACEAEERVLPAGDPDALLALTAVREHACTCKDSACAYRVMAELLEYSDKDPDLRDTQAGVKLADELTACLGAAVRNEPAPGSALDGGVAAGSTGLPACDEYVALVESYLRCDQFPESARDSTRQAVEQMRTGWSDMAHLSPDIRRTAEDACKQASDAMRQAGDAMGCRLTP